MPLHADGYSVEDGGKGTCAGTGQSVVLDGCVTMAIPSSDLNSVMTQDGIDTLDKKNPI